MKNLKFIRVQDALYGMSSDKEGNLTLLYDSQKNRNTVHFSVNSIVADHAYGKFNTNAEGIFTGKVVIIANSEDMMTPAALNQVDTWFRYGSNERSLNVGRATLVLPDDMPAPDNANVLRYDGTENHRNQVVENYLTNQNITMHSCSMRHWTDYDAAESIQWAETAAATLYPGHNVYIGMHDSSIDNQLESNSMKTYLDYLNKGIRYTQDDSGAENNILPKVESVNRQSIKTLKEFLKSLPIEEKTRIGNFYRRQIKEKISEIKEARLLDAKIKHIDTINYVHQTVSDFPGQGDFYINRGAEIIQVDNKKLEHMIVNNYLSRDTPIWRAGYKDNWEKLGLSPLKDSIDATNILPSNTVDIPKNTSSTQIPDKYSVLDKVASFRQKASLHSGFKIR